MIEGLVLPSGTVLSSPGYDNKIPMVRYPQRLYLQCYIMAVSGSPFLSHQGQLLRPILCLCLFSLRARLWLLHPAGYYDSSLRPAKLCCNPVLLGKVSRLFSLPWFSNADSGYRIWPTVVLLASGLYNLTFGNKTWSVWLNWMRMLF